MKILFIVPYPTEGPSNRFRVEQYLPELEKAGIEYSLRPFYGSSCYWLLKKRGYFLRKFFNLAFFSLRRLRDVLSCFFYDVVFIHREAFPAKNFIFEKLIRLFSKKLIYDFDDSIFLKKPAKIKMLLKEADYIIAGNKFLKDYALRFNKNVSILPTCIDTSKYKPSIKGSFDKKITIGWIGTASTSLYLDSLKEVFADLVKKYGDRIKIKLIGSQNINWAPPIINKNWILNKEVEELQSFDIGIMPMPDDDWTKGKCAFKLIQYMAAGIPSVASAVGMNLEAIEEGINGFLVRNTEEWREKLSILIESNDIRHKFGKIARDKAEREYSLNVNAPKFIKILKNTKGDS